MKQVKHLLTESSDMFKSEQEIIETVQKVNTDVGKYVIKGMYQKVMAALSPEWRKHMLGEGSVGEPERMVELNVERKGKGVKFKEVQTKCVYIDFLGDGMERPTSEKVWAKVFADFDVTKVWGNLNVKYNCIECDVIGSVSCKM